MFGPVRYNKVMFFTGLISWWYGAGWRVQAGRAKGRLLSTLDYFSIGLLLQTLFSPWRQISAGAVRGPLPVQLRAFFDRTFSRVIGAIVRSVMIAIGLLTVVLVSLLGVASLFLWAIVPLLPVVGIVMWLIGWTPVWI